MVRRWVLVKGLKQDARHWLDVPDRLRAALGDGAEVIPLDLPGVGRASGRHAPAHVDGLADDLRARFRDLAGDGPWGAVGLSLGGMAVLRWAQRHPGDLATVVVGNTSCAASSAPWRRLRAAAWPRIASTVAASDVTARERAVLDLVSSLRSAEEKDDLARHYTGIFEEIPVSRATILAQVRAGMSFRAPRGLGVPVHVLVGDGDRLVDPGCGRRLARRLGAPVHVHPAAGHDLGVDAPDWLVDRILHAAAEARSARAPGQPQATAP